MNEKINPGRLAALEARPSSGATLRRLNATSVMERLDISSRETLRKLVKKGLLPVPFQDFEGGPNYWLESDIAACIEAQAEKRNARTRAQEPPPTRASA